MSNKVMIGVGEYGAICEPGGILKTMALGSCVSVVIMDRKTRCVAMDHVALPDSSIAPDRVATEPGRFADTGIPALFEEMRKKANGQLSPPHGLIVKLAGGANVADPNNTFNIGKRNVLAIKKILWRYGLGPVAEDVGGNFSRTVTVYRDTGRITLTCPGRPDWQI